MAGYRSLVAPWLGGVSARSGSGSYRSLVAPWLGGASAPNDALPGFASLVAPWLGGASAPGEVAVLVPGFRSLVAPWLGGAWARSGGDDPPTPTPDLFRGGFRLPLNRRPRIDEDEEEILMTIIAAFLTIQSKP